MNKFTIVTFIAIVAVFSGIVYATQGNSSFKSNSQVPSLPPDADTFHMVSSAPALKGQEQQAQSQQQVQGEQTQAQPTFGVEEGIKASYSAVIRTTKGNIAVTLDGKDAPRTVKNFIDKIKSKFYTNLTFHRVEDWVIQGGDPKGDGTGGGLMQTEINALPFAPGSLGVARGNNINVSNDSQFFIVKTDASWLNQQYTNFGTVTDGMDVVNSVKVGDKILGITLESN